LAPARRPFRWFVTVPEPELDNMTQARIAGILLLLGFGLA
jgi:hypothetical protein